MTASPELSERIDALSRAVEIAAARLDARSVDAAERALGKVRERAGHGTDHTVVALVGSTGVGKSSLFNAVTGDRVSSTGVRRPTTSVAHAAIWGSGNPALLDWLHVGRRHHIDVDAGDPLAGLVLIDLPDFDSTEVTNRAEVDRVIELVDALVWVVDPQKYADEAFHDGYVRHFADYAGVMRFVVNKIDVVTGSQRRELIDDFTRRVVDDGVPNPSVIATSVTAGEGLDAVRDVLVASVTERRAMTQRLEADLRGVASALMPDGVGDGMSRGERRRFVERLGHAAGADSAGSIVDAQHRHDARGATGWPVTKLLSRWRRRHPIADLPRASASHAAGSEVGLALRDIAEAAGDGLAAPWPRVLRDVAADHAEGLRSDLTALTGRTARD
ncbi:MAG: GTPase, partial [Ilumatobacter sp.]